MIIVDNCSIEPMWPVSKDAELREDIQVLTKFWQSMHSDKKYMKYFMVTAPVDAGQLLPHSSSSSSQYTSGSSGLGPYLQVCFRGVCVVVLQVCSRSAMCELPIFEQNQISPQ